MRSAHHQAVTQFLPALANRIRVRPEPQETAGTQLIDQSFRRCQTCLMIWHALLFHPGFSLRRTSNGGVADGSTDYHVMHSEQSRRVPTRTSASDRLLRDPNPLVGELRHLAQRATTIFNDHPVEIPSRKIPHASCLAWGFCTASRHTQQRRSVAACSAQTYMSMPMPPIPPMPPGMPPAAGLSSASSATMASVVRIRPATEAAFCSAERVTLAGSSTPSSTRSP